MNDYDLFNELNNKTLKLSQSVKLLAQYGKELAQAEADYKTRLMQEALKLRSGDMPVTLIDKVVYGKVAKERFERDVADVMYRTAQENINSLKLQIRILDSQISREWSNDAK